jgi:hypothetical protein
LENPLQASTSHLIFDRWNTHRILALHPIREVLGIYMEERGTAGVYRRGHGWRFPDTLAHLPRPTLLSQPHTHLGIAHVQCWPFPRWCQTFWATSGIGSYLLWAGAAGPYLSIALWLWVGRPRRYSRCGYRYHAVTDAVPCPRRSGTVRLANRRLYHDLDCACLRSSQ